MPSTGTRGHVCIHIQTLINKRNNLLGNSREVDGSRRWKCQEAELGSQELQGVPSEEAMSEDSRLAAAET